jgi:threonine synthase
LATAHPAKFSEAVTGSLSTAKVPFDFEKDVLPKEMIGLLEKKRRMESVYLKDATSSQHPSSTVVEKLAQGTRKAIEKFASPGANGMGANTQSV